MIHRCYLHAIEAIVGGETIWNNMKHEKTIVFEQELSWRPDLHKAYVDRLSASRIRAAEQCVKLRFFDEQCQMYTDVHRCTQIATWKGQRAKHPGKPHILKSSISVEAAHSQNLNLRFRRHEMCQKLKVCLNKYLLEQLGFSPVWKCITKEHVVFKVERSKRQNLLAAGRNLLWHRLVATRNHGLRSKARRVEISADFVLSVKRHLKPRDAKTSCLSRGSIIPSSTSFAAPSDSQELDSPNIQKSQTTKVLDGFSHEFLMIFLYLC